MSSWISACVPTARWTLPSASALADRAAAWLLGAAGEQLDRDARIAQQVRQRQVVLLREHFGRREQRRLHLVRDGDEHRVERDDRLAAAHVALEQAVHRLAALQVLDDLPDRLLLGAGQLEREALADALVEQLVDPQHRRGDAARRAAAC